MCGTSLNFVHKKIGFVEKRGKCGLLVEWKKQYKEMKLWSSDFIFNAPWKQTTEAVWKKYPNDQMSNVAFIDVIDRKVTDDGKLLTTRLFGSQFNFPTLITHLLGLPEMCYAIELSEVDLKNQKMTLRMINHTFGSVLTVNEKLVYSPSKDNHNETHLKQGAKIQINGIAFANHFEQMLVDRFDSTSKVGRKAIQNVLKTITVENLLDTVKRELNELSLDIDKAVTKFDSEYNITEKLQELSKDLDTATDLINTEMQSFSNKLHSDFIQLIRTLDSELSQVTVKFNLPGDSDVDKSNLGLCEAVKKAGISSNTKSS